MLQRIEAISQYGASALPVSVNDADAPIQIRDIQGIGPVTATINTESNGDDNGAMFLGAQVPPRNIVFIFGLNPDWAEQTMASLRHLLYEYFMVPQNVTLNFFSDDLPPVGIAGYVERMEPVLFSNDPEIQVSIICPDPIFKALDATFLQGTTANMADGALIDYEGTSPTGFDFVLDRGALDTSYHSGFTLNLWNSREQNFTMEDSDVDAATYFRMRSVRGDRKVEQVTRASGVPTSVLGFMDNDSDWLQLEPKQNVLFMPEDDLLTWRLSYFARYGGL